MHNPVTWLRQKMNETVQMESPPYSPAKSILAFFVQQEGTMYSASLQSRVLKAAYFSPREMTEFAVSFGTPVHTACLL